MKFMATKPFKGGCYDSKYKHVMFPLCTLARTMKFTYITSTLLSIILATTLNASIQYWTTNVQCVKTKVGECALKLWQGSKYNKYKWNEFKGIKPCLEGANSFDPWGLEGFYDVINVVSITTKWVDVTSQTLIFFPKNRWKHHYMQ
jgi:hypothetical protein